MNKIEKLNHLENILRDVAAKQLPFNLEFWGKDVSDCGFAGCAIGYAGRDPVFNELGFVLRRDTHSNYHSNDVEVTIFPQCYRTDGWKVTSADAVRYFFELSTIEMQYLFYDDNYPKTDIEDPLAVANRLREFIIAECEKEVTVR